MRPTGFLGHPEDVLGLVFVGVLRVSTLVITFPGNELGVHFLEGIGDVFQEDQAQDDVLVFSRVHIVAQLIGGEPELGLEAEVGGGVFCSATLLPLGRHNGRS